MAQYYSLLQTLLVVLRGCDSLLYQHVDGSGFFYAHEQPSTQLRLVCYIFAQRYLNHHDPEFIRRCECVRGQFTLTSALCGLIVVSLIALAILTESQAKKNGRLTVWPYAAAVKSALVSTSRGCRPE